MSTYRRTSLTNSENWTFSIKIGLNKNIIWGGSWEKVHNVKIFKFCFSTDSYGGFNEEASIENRLKKYWVITKLWHFLWHAFACIFMTRHDFDRGFLHFAAADVVYLFAWAAPYHSVVPFICAGSWSFPSAEDLPVACCTPPARSWEKRKGDDGNIPFVHLQSEFLVNIRTSGNWCFNFVFLLYSPSPSPSPFFYKQQSAYWLRLSA